MKNAEAARNNDGPYNKALLNNEEKESLRSAIQAVSDEASLTDSKLIEANYIFSEMGEDTGNYCFFIENN